MRNKTKLPAALTVAGSDSGGGAGIQADLKTFAALEVHGLCAITSITAQNPRGVLAARGCAPALVREQLRAVSVFDPRAAKTGMLLSAPIIREVAAFFRANRQIQLVVDPVMIATSGARLLERAAKGALEDELLPLAMLVTPNVPEAEALTGLRMRAPEDLRTAARALHRQFGCAALVKGGHLRTGTTAIDVFYDGSEELLLEAARARGVATHGTGCTFAAAITAHLARGAKPAAAATAAKEFVTNAIHRSVRAGRFAVLNWGGAA
jgi:hydroxymethylpyrimidine/phosphomethylpyrimidine kinase